MRILLVSCAVSPLHGGGVANLVRRIGEGLAARGHRVAMFTEVSPPMRAQRTLAQAAMGSPRGSPAASRHGRSRFSRSTHVFADGALTIFAAPLPERGFLDRYVERDYFHAAAHEGYDEALAEFEPDVVHFHAIQGLGVGLIDRTPAHVATVLTMHDYWWVCPNIFMAHLDDTLCELRRADAGACARCLGELRVQSKAARVDADLISKRGAFLADRLRRVDRVLAVSNSLRDRLAGFLPDLDLTVCENGIDGARGDADSGSARARATTSRSAVGGGAATVRFGFTGGTSRLKGFAVLMKAMERLERDDLRLDVHGVQLTARQRIAQRWPGLKRAYRRARGHPVVRGHPFGDPRIRLHRPFGAVDATRVYSAMDALIVPSVVTESFSLVAREAMRAGTPVIASRCGGPEEIVRNGENGLLVNAGDAEQLAAAMRRCVEEAGLLARLRAGAGKTAIRTRGAMVEQIEGEYGMAHAIARQRSAGNARDRVILAQPGIREPAD